MPSVSRGKKAPAGQVQDPGPSTQSGSATDGGSLQWRPQYVLPLCELPLPEYGRPQSLHWNDHGQACVVTETVVYVMTPSMGYHPLLKPNQPSQVDPDSLLDIPSTSAGGTAKTVHSVGIEFTGKAKPLDFFGSGIDLASSQAVTVSKPIDRALNPYDYDAVNLGEIGTIFKHVSWSPAGLGAYDSCLLATLSTNGDIKIVASSGKNPVVGPWMTVHALNVSEGAAHDGRFEVLADQAICIAWSPVVDHQGNKLAVLAAGTRAGEVVLWCHSGSHKGFSKPTRIQVGRSAVTSLSWCQGGWQESKDGPLAIKIAAALNTGPLTLDVAISPESDAPTLVVAPSFMQPPSLPDMPQISLLQSLSDGRLLVTCPGQVRTWAPPDEDDQMLIDTADGQPAEMRIGGEWQTCQLIVPEDGQDSKDPFAPGVCAIVRDNILHLTLSSRLEYHMSIPLPASVFPRRSVTTQRSTTLYPLLRESEYLLSDLAQQVEDRQILLGHGATSGSHAQVVGIVQTEGDISAFRVRLDRSCKLSLVLQINGGHEGEEAPTPLRILECILGEVASGSALDGATPIQVYRPLLALYYASTMSLQKVLLVEMIKYASSAATSDSRRQFWLCKWLQREAASFKPWSESLKTAVTALDQVTDALYVRLVAQWLLGELKAVTGSTENISSAASMTFVRRLVAVTSWLLYQQEGQDEHSAQLEELTKEVARIVKIFGLESADVERWRTGEDATLHETCPACSSAVSFSPASGTASFRLPEWVQCPSGHVFKRCGLTFDILASSHVRTCEGCWSKSNVPDEQSGAPVAIAALKRCGSRCNFCGCRWLSLV